MLLSVERPATMAVPIGRRHQRRTRSALTGDALGGARGHTKKPAPARVHVLLSGCAAAHVQSVPKRAMRRGGR